MLAALALGLSSCHTSRHTVRGSRGQRTEQPAERPADDIYYDPHDNGAHGVSNIIEYAREWIGTPYRYGGNDRSGVDCSGFTCSVYSAAAGIELPRSSREQADYCRKVDRDKLRAGDLVFFTSAPGGSRINHVALYMGDGRIIHSTTSRGVIISELSERYWDTRYYRGGRVRENP